MNSVDSARVIAALQGAFPYAKVDDATVMVWANSLDTMDYASAMLAAQRWIDEREFFPSVAAFNGMVTEIRREQRDDGPPEIMRTSAIRCDGTGWFTRGSGLEPCPTCNPWNRDRWMTGDWEQRSRPPSGYLMPGACHASHAGEGPIVTSKQRAMQLVLGGLREQLAENGLSPDEIDEAVERRMMTVLAAVAGVES